MKARNSLIFLISGVIGGLIGNFISMWLLTRAGRRRLMITTLTPLVALWLVLGIIGCFESAATPW